MNAARLAFIHSGLLLASLLLAGCSAQREAKISENFQVDYDSVVPAKKKIADGSLYSPALTGFFVGDRRARNVGDVITINLAETMAATKSNDGSVTRKGTTALGLPGVLFGPGSLFSGTIGNSANFAANTAQTFAGTGAANQSNSITGKVTVMVTRVYENGNMWIQGQKALTLNQGEEYVRVSGLVRPEDIKTGNIVDSSNIAQATISYTGAGDLADAAKENWFGRFFTQAAPI